MKRRKSDPTDMAASHESKPARPECSDQKEDALRFEQLHTLAVHEEAEQGPGEAHSVCVAGSLPDMA